MQGYFCLDGSENIFIWWMGKLTGSDLCGVPVGIPHMFIIIPWHWDLSGILGMAALCVIVGGVFGCVIAAWLGIRAVWYMVGFPISKIVAIHKRVC